MIYLDHGATSFPKPEPVRNAVALAMETCANPGRGSHSLSENAQQRLYDCRCAAGELFHCAPEQVVFTQNCTQGLNMALRSLVRPGDRVVISGFEHNAVTRPLHLLGAEIRVAGRRLFDPADTLSAFRKALDRGAKAAVFTQVSNVFGYVLPVEELAAECRSRGIPFVVDAAQSAGKMKVDFSALGADFIAMPGHKGLLGPQGTGLLLCSGETQPLLLGGTGSDSLRQSMPENLPERLEAGTLNVPGIAGLAAGLAYLERTGVENIGKRERIQGKKCAEGLKKMGFTVFSGLHQSGTVSFLPEGDCEEFAAKLAQRGIAVRAGLHCAPLAHESAGTLETGTVRVSFGHDASDWQTAQFLQGVAKEILRKS